MNHLRRIALSLILFCVSASAPAADDAAFDQARESARIAGFSLGKVHRWLHEVALPRIDKETGLYIADGKWNYRDTAADCYPFLTWAAWAVDKEALDGPVRDILHAERRLCNELDRIPTSYDWKNKKKITVKHAELVFQASEYVKDGLIAIVEITGRDEWFDRMREIEDDLWKHADIDTPFGKILSTNVEVNGEQIQALVRLYTMTGEEKYLNWAERLADYYFANEDWVPTRLRDHGCEIIGGLGLLLGVESEHRPAKAKVYAAHFKRVLDAVIARGCTPDGMMVNTLHKAGSDAPSGAKTERLSDGWGYNYVGHLCYDAAAGRPVYRPQIERTLGNLNKPLYENYPWEGESIDGYADSIEGAIYLLNRVPSPVGLAWVNRETDVNLVRHPKRLERGELWGTMKLQANGVRTVLMHALMHTRGAVARPWRRDLQLGASEIDGGVAIVMKAEKAYAGKLEFDIPRHKAYMGFKHDWPRMNTIPEWFTVELDQTYVLKNLTTGDETRYTGKQLHEGAPIELKAAVEARFQLVATEK